MRSFITLLLTCFLYLTSNATTDKYRLMFNDDPATTITLGWEQASGSNPEVYYGTTDHGTNWAAYSNSITPYRATSYMGMDNRFAILTGLQPNTAYYFVIKDSDGTGDRFWFKTCPDDNTQKLSFISGGDSRSGQTQRRKSNEMVAKIRPHAVLFGGDLVDTPGNSSVQTWFEDWKLSYTSDGQIIPLVHSFGNHEDYGTGGPEFINELFDCTYDVYYKVTFGGDLFSVYTLNGELLPGHTIANASKRTAQTNWLSTTLASDPAIWKSAQYHRPIVPHYSGKGEGDDEFDDWANLFYTYDVRLVMESDAHVTKVTEEVKPAMSTASGNSDTWFTTSGIPQGKGINFIGEGAWGTIRTPDDSHPLTTAMTSMYQFAWITVDQCRIEVRTIDTQSPGTVPEHTAGDYFSISQGLEDQIWKPTGLPSGIRTIINCNSPVADFTASLTTAFTGQSINFTDLSSDTPTSWLWNFGDGNTSTQQNPSHSYASPGTYEVILSATNADGTGSVTKVDYITVYNPTPPVADFTVDDATPSNTQVVQFTDLSTGIPTAWAWNFGDGGTATSQNPTHAYGASGVYDVTLVATNAYGSDTITKTNYVTVSNGGSISVFVNQGTDDAEEFRVGSISGDMYLNSSDLEIGNDGGDEQYMAVRFQGVNVPQGATISNAKITFRGDEEDGAGSQLNIYFGGENVDDAQTFTNTNYDISSRPLTSSMVLWADGTVPAWYEEIYYDSPDLSTIVQEIVDRSGWTAGNAMAFILWSDLGESSERVADSYEGGYPPELSFDWTIPDAPVAGFSQNVTGICEGESIQFTDASSNNPSSWSWDFGDGNTSTQQNPVHSYTSAGTYSISLTASNTQGSNTLTENDLIVVHPNPTVTIDAFAEDSLCSDASAVPIPNHSPTGGTFSGDGVSGNNFDPIVAGNGNHTITYTYTDNNGCESSAQTSIMVVDCATSVEEVSADGVSIFPNPSEDIVNIVFSGIQASSIKVYNQLGQIMYSEDNLNGQQVQLSVEKWSAGNYTVQIFNSNGTVLKTAYLIVK